MSFLTSSSRLALSTFVLSVLMSVSFASALTISPARLEVSADPGETITKDFLLINEQEVDQVYYTSVENFQAQGESGTPNFIPSKEGLASWVQVAEKVTIKKGERVEVPFTITVPKDGDAGGHFAAIFLSTVPPSTQAGEVAVGAKVGMLILLRINGDLKEQGGILSFSLKDEVRFVTKLPVTFLYRFQNGGNDRINPTGEISVINSFGFETDRLNANPSVGNILPGSTRRFEVVWGDDTPLPPSASFFSNVGYEARNFAFGFYKAKVNLTFGSSLTANSSTYFFVFPWHLFVVVMASLLVLFFVLRSLLKRYNRWIIKQAQIHAQ